MASTASNFSVPLSPDTAEVCGTQALPEVMAHTPQGTMVNWEELFDVRLVPCKIETKIPKHAVNALSFEPRREKTCLQCFRTGPTQTGLYSH